MATNDTDVLARRHLLTSDIRPRMAKADLRKPDEWRERIVRGAMCIGLIGFVLFMVSEQVREIYAIARERKAQERMR